MTNEAKSIEIVKATSYLQNLTEFEAMQHCAMKMANFKDTQPISELEGWHTEPPTKDCTVLLYITEQTLTVSRWNSPNKMFYENVYMYSKPIKKWIKWKKSA